MKRFLTNLFRCESSPPPLVEGGLYHLPDEKGRFKVLKVLKLDDAGVHVRLFSNVFPSPPTQVEESSL